MAVLDVKSITRNFIENYDIYTMILIRDLQTVGCYLSCSFQSFEECILNKETYACSIEFNRGRKLKALKYVWPIMIGSKIDVLFRKQQISVFEDIENEPNLLDYDIASDEADIAITCFFINGSLKQIPVFYTNDVTNIHTKSNAIVRVYKYDLQEKGSELNFYVDNIGKHSCGDLLMRLNSGQMITPSDYEIQTFFECPFPIKPKVYFRLVYTETFDIDHLGNKVFFSPGHIFYRLYKKTLHFSLRFDSTKEIRKWYNIIE